MEVLRIRGGLRLEGEVQVAGSKNAALALLAGSILTEEDILLRNLPDVRDVRIKVDLLREIGVKADWTDDGLWLNAKHLRSGIVPPEGCRSIRTAFYLLGPLLARVGECVVPLPGGCNIGARPVNFHVRGLKTLGASLVLREGCYHANAEKLIGGDIYLDFPSAGATQHLMTAAVLAEGATSIHNCAIEPEVVALADFLNRLGARIDGAGTSTVTIEGVKRLGGGEFPVPADRLQAGTYLLAGAASRGDVTVRAMVPEHLHSLIAKLREAGAQVTEGHDWLRVSQPNRPKAVDVRTMPHPGFPTDLQQPMCAYLATATGTSLISETIYEARIGHVAELRRMGADIRVDGRNISITGVERLTGAKVTATDLRAGASLIVAALGAEGETELHNLQNVERGYEHVDTILGSLGADIERATVPDPMDVVAK
ncbi:MAG: UDP-N-acetylglucosamine 1-carboxyvinyltransferase [Fimbriimonadia bacterium]